MKKNIKLLYFQYNFICYLLYFFHVYPSKQFSLHNKSRNKDIIQKSYIILTFFI